MTNTPEFPESPLTHEPPVSGPTPPPTGAPGEYGPTSAPAGAPFFDAIRRFGVVRPDTGRMAAGVSAGIARRYGVDPVVIRIAFVVLTLFGGLGVALYGLGWLLLPHPDGRIHAQELLAGRVTAGFLGALAIVILSSHTSIPLLLVALVAYLVVQHQRRTHQPVA